MTFENNDNVERIPLTIQWYINCDSMIYTLFLNESHSYHVHRHNYINGHNQRKHNSNNLLFK